MPGGNVSCCGTIRKYVGVVGLATRPHAETDVFDQLHTAWVR